MQQLAPAPHSKRDGLLAQHELTQEQSLREHLLHHVNESNQVAATSNQRANVGVHVPQVSSPSTPAHNIDPAIAGTGMMSHSPGDSGGDENGTLDSKKAGRRELSTSKRAAQNRAAQRAFRQRKEGHIKKLEEQVRDAQTLAENFKAIERENFTLRDYIISLQSRLIESQGDFPPPPMNINLPRPMSGATSAGATITAGGEYAQAPTAPMVGSPGMNLQQSAAQAVADLSKDPRQTEMNTDPALVGKPARA